MTRSLTVNGTTFPYPSEGDRLWADAATGWAEAMTNGTLQKTGGTFVLSSDLDFGPTGGLKALYFGSRTVPSATVGVLRLANAETLAWRNFGNNSNATFALDTSDRLVYNTPTLNGAFIISTNGNVGLAISPAANKFAVQASNQGGISVGGNTTTGSVVNDIIVQRNGSEVSTFGQGSSLSLLNGTLSGVAIQQFSNNLQFFNFNGGSWNEKMRLDPSGNIAVTGTSATSGGAISINVANSQSGAACTLNATGSTFNSGGVGNSTALVSSGSGNTNLAVGPLGAGTGFLQFVANNAERMRIDVSGNLGLGLTPSAWGSTNNKAFQFKAPNSTGATGSLGSVLSTDEIIMSRNAYHNGAGWVYLISSSPATSYQISSAGSHIWSTAPVGTAGNIVSYTQEMTLDPNGNLLIGKSSTGANDNGAQIFPTGTLGLGHVAGTASGTAYAAFGYNGSGIGSITQNGTTGVLYNVTSDQRLKENIVDAPSQSSVIDSVQVRQFNFKTEPERTQLGFIAQELHLVVPNAVKTGSVGDDMSDTWGVDFSKLVPLLVKEVQELRIRVAQLETNGK